MSFLRKEEKHEEHPDDQTPGPQPGEVEKVPAPPLVTVGPPPHEVEEEDEERAGERPNPDDQGI